MRYFFEAFVRTGTEAQSRIVDYRLFPDNLWGLVRAMWWAKKRRAKGVSVGVLDVSTSHEDRLPPVSALSKTDAFDWYVLHSDGLVGVFAEMVIGMFYGMRRTRVALRRRAEIMRLIQNRSPQKRMERFEKARVLAAGFSGRKYREMMATIHTYESTP